MKFKAALFYHDSLVYYSIYHLGENFYKAKLEGDAHPCAAPQVLELHRESQLWISNCADNIVVKELGAAIDQRTLTA
jgi:hypothetical protein